MGALSFQRAPLGLSLKFLHPDFTRELFRRFRNTNLFGSPIGEIIVFASAATKRPMRIGLCVSAWVATSGACDPSSFSSDGQTGIQYPMSGGPSG